MTITLPDVGLEPSIGNNANGAITCCGCVALVTTRHSERCDLLMKQGLCQKQLWREWISGEFARRA